MHDTARIRSFSDGVFAILITILVLEFKIPNFKPGELSSVLVHQWPLFISYAMSYLYVGTLWLFHHDLMNYVVRVTRMLNIINLFILFCITLIDYPMSLIGAALESGNLNDLQTTIIVYDAVALTVSFSFFWMYLYIQRHPRVHGNKIPDQFFSKIRRDPVTSVSIYGASILASFWSIWLSILLLSAGIVFHFVAYLRLSTKLWHLGRSLHLAEKKSKQAEDNNLEKGN